MIQQELSVVDKLNIKFEPLDVYQRVEELYKTFDQSEIMLTSSFAATSAFLLKVFSDVNNTQPIHFIDTGYHFEETMIYKDYLTKLYNLKVIDIKADEKEHQTTQDEKMWTSQPNKCCDINKVQPLNALKHNYKVWVSGLMKWQSDFRSSLNYYEERDNILKFYPLLDIGYEERDQFIIDHHLPFHPLKSKGYSSIGCQHCTVPGDDRTGRWNNSPKTECGLHL